MATVTLVRKVRLLVAAAAAKPGPAIGQALGPLGLNMSDFCKKFNDATKDYVKDVPIPVTLSAYSNRTFTFVTKTPPTSWFLKKCSGIDKGCGRPAHDYVGEVHIKHIYTIAQIKKNKDTHLQHLSLEAICRSIIGSAQSMGIRVVTGEVTDHDYTAARARNAELKRGKQGGAKAAGGKKK